MCSTRQMNFIVESILEMNRDEAVELIRCLNERSGLVSGVDLINTTWGTSVGLDDNVETDDEVESIGVWPPLDVVEDDLIDFVEIQYTEEYLKNIQMEIGKSKRMQIMIDTIIRLNNDEPSKWNIISDECIVEEYSLIVVKNNTSGITNYIYRNEPCNVRDKELMIHLNTNYKEYIREEVRYLKRNGIQINVSWIVNNFIQGLRKLNSKTIVLEDGFNEDGFKIPIVDSILGYSSDGRNPSSIENKCGVCERLQKALDNDIGRQMEYIMTIRPTTQQECCVCYESTHIITPCQHPLCGNCQTQIPHNFRLECIPCPLCRSPL